MTLWLYPAHLATEPGDTFEVAFWTRAELENAVHPVPDDSGGQLGVWQALHTENL
jgi:hypothetical protein